MNDNPDEIMEKTLAEADRLAAELDAELEAAGIAGDTIGDMPELPEGLTPEMLENMDPAQLQQFLAQFSQRKRRSQAFYTRKRTTKAERKNKRNIQKRSRAVNARKRKAA